MGVIMASARLRIPILLATACLLPASELAQSTVPAQPMAAPGLADTTTNLGLATGFWVPQQVTVSVDWNGKHLRNEHRYSEFKLFQVEATEKNGKRKEVSQTSDHK